MGKISGGLGPMSGLNRDPNPPEEKNKGKLKLTLTDLSQKLIVAAFNLDGEEGAVLKAMQALCLNAGGPFVDLVNSDNTEFDFKTL